MRTASQCSCGVLVGHEKDAPGIVCPGCFTLYNRKDVTLLEADRHVEPHVNKMFWIGARSKDWMQSVKDCKLANPDYE